MPADLFDFLPPLMDLVKGFFTRASMPYQPTADHSAGSPDSSPAVDVHRLAVSHGGVDSVEHIRHLMGVARDAQVDNRMPLVPSGHANMRGFALYDIGIRYQLRLLG